MLNEGICFVLYLYLYLRYVKKSYYVDYLLDPFYIDQELQFLKMLTDNGSNCCNYNDNDNNSKTPLVAFQAIPPFKSEFGINKLLLFNLFNLFSFILHAQVEKKINDPKV